MCFWLELGAWVSMWRPSPPHWTQIKIIIFTSVRQSCQKHYLLQALQHLSLHPPHASSSFCFQTSRLLRGGRSWCFSQLASTLENPLPPSFVKVKLLFWAGDLSHWFDADAAAVCTSQFSAGVVYKGIKLIPIEGQPTDASSEFGWFAAAETIVLLFESWIHYKSKSIKITMWIDYFLYSIYAKPS